MSVDQFKTQIQGFIVETFLFGEQGDFKGDDSLLEKGIVDSSGVLELIGYLEESFKIEIGDDEITPENLDSVTKIAQFVQRKQS